MPERHPTTTPATTPDTTECDDKLIPLSEVTRLLEVVAQMIHQGAPMTADLVVAYDITAKAAGWNSAEHLTNRRRNPIGDPVAVARSRAELCD